MSLHKASVLGVLALALLALSVDAARARTRVPRDPHAFGPAPRAAPIPPYKTLYFEQTIDHFNMLGEPQVFAQRYLVADQFFSAGGPILFYTGNEGDIVSFYNNTGLVFEWAQQLGGYVVFAEHRYYGESMPFGAASFDIPQIGFLSSEQALADYAVLITALKADTPALADAFVLAVGGSYGGMLAAWMRMKYPNIVAGALAASAPVLEFVGLVDGERFSEVCTADFAQAADGCAGFIQNAFNVLIPSVAARPGGYAEISAAMQLCTVIDSEDDVDLLFDWAQAAFLYLAVCDYPYPADFLQSLPANPVNASCALALAHDGSEMARLASFAQAAGLFYNGSGTESCFNISQPVSPNLGMTAWDYQACTEMVFPIEQNGVTDMFWPVPFNLTQYTQGCQAEFGVTPRADWLPIQFGGRAIAPATNIIFSNGNLDPWSSGGVLESLSESLPAIVIDGGAHHLDLRWSDPADPVSVIRARELEYAYVYKWFTEYRARLA